MRFRLFLIIVIVYSGLFASWCLASDKKGIGLAELKSPERISALNVAWYYTWKPQPIDGAPVEKFVPMIWGGKRLDKEIAFIHSKNRVPILLGFNEPNKVDQSNMSVQKALREWTRLESLADRLGSPAPAGVLGPWFDRFYHEAKKKNLKMDFMAIHLYSPPDPQKFLAKIDAVYKKYQMPIWITEFAVVDWEAKDKRGSNRYSEEEVLAFMRAVLPELEKRPFIERYAWFGAGNYSLQHEQVRTSRLFEKDGTLTALGRFYAEFQ